MIMFQKTLPQGIDTWIDRFQKQQERELPLLFGVDANTCLFYGRTEKIGNKIVVYNTSTKYVDVGFDNKYSFISYFVLGDTFNSNGLLQSNDASLVVHSDLNKMYPSISHRADEEIRQDMIKFVHKFIEPQDMRETKIIRSELQPFHSFIINFKINY